MRSFIFFIFVFGSSLALAASAKANKVNTPTNVDKIYSVKKSTPEITIGEDTIQADLEGHKFKRPVEFWFVGAVRSSLNYHLSSFVGSSLEFSPQSVGLTVGKKRQDQFFLYKGYYELSLEWQRFSRQLVYSQKLDLVQINIFQNFDVAWAFKHSALFSVGLGLAPLYLGTEQSVLGNSISELGYIGMLKANVSVPLKALTKQYLEIDLALRLGWGNVGGHEISTTALFLGLNFE
jgi:hypothetical protein